ncbi:MAG: hypothetical protein K8F25_07860, partial [Fimbriimonadaceae bacterium]|nr:hypothetical protein [Alphaproteobacteria bacterium]
MAGDGNKKTDEPDSAVSEFARNMISLLEESGKAVSAYLEPRAGENPPGSQDSEFAQMTKTIGAVAERWLSDPKKAVEAHTDLWTGYANLWSRTVRRAIGEDADPTVAPAPGDKRFKDNEWTSNQYFDFLKQAYLLTSNWADRLVEDAEDLDEHTRKKAEFYITQLSNALSPSNFVFTNPEVLRET